MTNITVKQIVSKIRKELSSFYPPHEAEALIVRIIEHTLELSRTDVYLKPDTNVPKTELQEIEKIVDGLKKFEPLQYILGVTSFYDLNFKVNPHVLIPRPETEELVYWILKENTQSYSQIIDLGTGSGCIAVSLAKHRPHWEVSGIDISGEAIQIAQLNANLNLVHVDFYEESMFNFSERILSQKFHIIVSNPPYVSADQKPEMHTNVLDYEPHLALFAPGSDPLIFYCQIASFANITLAKGGIIYVEINEKFSEETSAIFKREGFETILKKDINDKFRMLKAFKHE